MGEAYECDRCGRVEAGTPAFVVWDYDPEDPDMTIEEAERMGRYNHGGSELCPDCKKEYREFMGGTDRQRGPF